VFLELRKDRVYGRIGFKNPIYGRMVVVCAHLVFACGFVDGVLEPYLYEDNMHEKKKRRYSRFKGFHR
jgi:hypothetical protein